MKKLLGKSAKPKTLENNHFQFPYFSPLLVVGQAFWKVRKKKEPTTVKAAAAVLLSNIIEESMGFLGKNRGAHSQPHTNRISRNRKDTSMKRGQLGTRQRERERSSYNFSSFLIEKRAIVGRRRSSIGREVKGLGVNTWTKVEWNESLTNPVETRAKTLFFGL